MSHCTVAVRYPAAVIIPAFTCRLRGVQAPADLSQENVGVPSLRLGSAMLQ